MPPQLVELVGTNNSDPREIFLTKLLGYSFTIVYKRECENLIVDALSRVVFDEGEMWLTQLHLLTYALLPGWLSQLWEKNTKDPWILEKHGLLITRDNEKEFNIHYSLLMFKTQFNIEPKSMTRSSILEECHNSKEGGHVGYFRTLQGVLL